MKSRSDSQLTLPPAPLQSLSPDLDARKKVSPDASDAESARLFDEALSEARISSNWLAGELKVSESLVSRWRSPNYTEAPSLTQVRRLPLSFQLEYHRAISRHFGFGRQALARLLEAAGELALGER